MKGQALTSTMLGIALAVLGVIWNDLRDVKRDTADVRERVARIEGVRVVGAAQVQTNFSATH